MPCQTSSHARTISGMFANPVVQPISKISWCFTVRQAEWQNFQHNIYMAWLQPRYIHRWLRPDMAWVLPAMQTAHKIHHCYNSSINKVTSYITSRSFSTCHWCIPCRTLLPTLFKPNNQDKVRNKWPGSMLTMLLYPSNGVPVPKTYLPAEGCKSAKNNWLTE